MKTISFNEIDSTSLYIKKNYQLLDDFTFVSSLYQSLGKGRMSRTWNSTKGNNLLFSLLLKDENILNKYNGLSLLSSFCIYR